MFGRKQRKAKAVLATYNKGYNEGHEIGFLKGREDARQLSLTKLMKKITTLDVRITSLERLATQPRK